MKDTTEKKRLNLEFHPSDFAATEQASGLAGVDTAEFCRLAIHVATRSTLAGNGILRLRGKRNGAATDAPPEESPQNSSVLACEN